MNALLQYKIILLPSKNPVLLNESLTQKCWSSVLLSPYLGRLIRNFFRFVANKVYKQLNSTLKNGVTMSVDKVLFSCDVRDILS